MLETIRIKNLAVIDEAEVNFKGGLNVLSGETGAGKSVVLEAVSLLLGSRASSDLIRKGCEEATVEGIFDLASISWISERLSRFGFDHEASELLIRRVIHKSGRHRIYINGELATVAILQDLCEGLVDLCGQHEHQSLLKPQIQLDLLDRYGGLEKKSETFATSFSHMRSLRSERDTLCGNEEDRLRRADFLHFQIEELRGAELREGEEEDLQKEKRLLQSTEVRAQKVDEARGFLEGENATVMDGIRAVHGSIKELAEIDESSSNLMEHLDRAKAEIEEVSLSLSRYLDKMERDPDRLSLVQDRLAQLASLRRKYGKDIDSMVERLESLEKEAENLTHVNERLEELKGELEDAEAELYGLGRQLSEARKKVAGLFSESVTGELKDLKMAHSRFEVDLSEKEELVEWTARTGANFIQFLLQSNEGESTLPLSRIASGGELSRVMLAIRRVISDKGGIGVYLFDEIDAGIGGEVALAVGKKLKSVSAFNQVICITHLPQIASFADHHLSVRKKTARKRTSTAILPLDQKGRREEIARMIGGDRITKTALQSAQELIKNASL